MKEIQNNLKEDIMVLTSAEESFKQGWKEMLAGETLPIEELWDGIDAD